MPLSVLAAVLIGALLHAGWNILVKREPDKLLATAGLYLGSGFIAAALLPLLPPPAPAAFAFLAASTLCELLYGVLLSRAYHLGDLSHAYPLMRGTPPLLVAVGSALFAGEHLPCWAWVGVGLVSAGILSLVLHAHRGPRRTGNATATRLALLNAGVIASYTLIDGLGVRASGQPLSYILWLFLLIGSAWMLWALLMAGTQSRLQLLRNAPRSLAGGACSLGSYGIALWAMTRAPIAAVAAVRETSIVFGLLLGRLVLKERITPARAIAALLVTLGVYLIRGSSR
ncbi:MAG: EamA family transporter [Steroidobacteraceae bacterium]